MVMTTITREEMEQDLVDDLRWIRANDPNLEAEWDAVLADSTPDTEVLAYDLGGSDYVHVMPEHDFALATFGQSEPRSVAIEVPAGLRIVEDNAGGLWLYGRTNAGDAVYTGDLAYSGYGTGVSELVQAFHDGVEGWEHGQDNDQPICFTPQGKIIAEYDGDTATLNVRDMGTAGRLYLLGESGAEVLR